MLGNSAEFPNLGSPKVKLKGRKIGGYGYADRFKCWLKLWRRLYKYCS